MTTEFSQSRPLHSVSGADLVRYLQDAHLPTLLPALAFASGDLALLKTHLRPSYVSMPLGLESHGGLSEEAQDEVRAVALAALHRLRSDHAVASPVPPEELRALVEYMIGDVSDDYMPLLLHELGQPGDAGAPQWTKDDIAPDTKFTVAIIGAGLSGLAAAHRLSQAGIDFTIFERNGDLGGVWQENSYPGARLDTSNYSYSYSFLQDETWTEQYSTRESVLDYLLRAADELNLRQHIRFTTRVTDGAWSDERKTWLLSIEEQDGSREQREFQAVITAVGQLNQPSVPRIPGLDTFSGHSWHTARWNHEIDLQGKRVGVIGTGASAFQAIPHIAEIADELVVFQRTPPWIMPTDGYHSPMPAGLVWLFENVPGYSSFFRLYQFWSSVESRLPYAVVDPEWNHTVSISQQNEELRRALIADLEESFSGRPDLLENSIPDYPPYGKRMLRDDGTWARTLKLTNVALEPDAIAEVVPSGIRTASGRLHELDVIIFGTGFTASDFLSSVTLTGRNGIDIHEQWDGDARAYFGIRVPNFPNLFCLYGPNTNLNANGSIVLMVEAAVEYVVESIRVLLESGRAAADVRNDVVESFNLRVDEASRQMAYGVPGVTSWYKNSQGRVSQNWPLRSLDYWNGTRRFTKSDYEFL